MKRSELKDIIRESVEEVMNEFAPLGVADESKLNEKTKHKFPPKLAAAIVNKYSHQGKEVPEKVQAAIAERMQNGDKRVAKLYEMWLSTTEAEEQETPHDETDLSNPEENKEVELAKKMKELANELLAMHGVTDEEGEESEESGEESEEETGEESGEETGEEETEQLDEKWNKKNVVHPSKKGMFKGKTKAELEKQLAALKARGPHKKGSKEYTKMQELNFAIRAKSGWPKGKKK